mgnify:CR=1 FL=1
MIGVQNFQPVFLTFTILLIIILFISFYHDNLTLGGATDVSVHHCKYAKMQNDENERSYPVQVLFAFGMVITVSNCISATVKPEWEGCVRGRS